MNLTVYDTRVTDFASQRIYVQSNVPAHESTYPSKCIPMYLKSHVRTSQSQPCLVREPVRNVPNYEQSEKRTRLRCRKFRDLIQRHHPLIGICSHILPITPVLSSRKLFEFVGPIHY